MSVSTELPAKSTESKKKRKTQLDDEDDFFSLGTRDSRRKKKKKSRANVVEDWLGSDFPSQSPPPKPEPIEQVESEPKIESELLSSEPDHEIIVLDDDNEEEIIPRKTGNMSLRPKTRNTSIESPKVETRSRSKTQSSPVKSPRKVEKVPEKIEDIDEFGEEEMFKDIMKSIRGIQTERKSDSNYEFTDANEVDRPYLIDVLPKIHTDRLTRFTTKGTKLFGGILLVILQHYKKLNLVPKGCKPADFSLFWIQGRREIKTFFKPSTLRIMPPPEKDMVEIGDIKYTRIQCLLVSKDSAASALDIYEELKPKSAAFMGPPDLGYLEDIEEIESNEDQLDENLKKELDEYIEKERLQNMNGAGAKSSSPGQEVIDLDQEDDESFIIGLKGKDNKRVEVRVSPHTKIIKILEYYMKQLNIDKRSVNMKKARLVFDDEQLELQDIVGNTELEDDFEIQVYL